MELSQKEILGKAMQLCSRKEYGSKEMYDKIISWGCTPDEARSVISTLTDQKFIDDRRYTEAYVTDKLRFNKWGRIKISYMLHMLGISDNLIKEALSAIDEKQYMAVLKDELTKKRKSIRKGAPYEIKAKLYRFAATRGFEAEIINQVINQ